MKSRINRYMVFLVISSILLVGTISVLFSYKIYKDNAEEDLRQSARIFNDLKSRYSSEEISEILNSGHSYAIRITEIDSDGVVIFDNSYTTEDMDNHLNRPEIIDAIEHGSGEDVRYSDTIRKTKYYYAYKYGDNIIRFSRDMSNIFNIFLGIVPLILVPMVIVLIASIILSSKLSNSIVEPVGNMLKQINIFGYSHDNNVKTHQYPEFIPIERELQHLSDEIQNYIVKLKYQKEEIKTITENMLEGMIMLDENNDILSVNRSAIQILNPNFDVKAMKNFLQLTRNRELINALDELKNAENINMVMTGNQDKATKYYRVLGNRVKSGKSNGAILFIIDITESYQTAQIRRDFASNITHELKTPLTTIKGFGEMMSHGDITEASDVKRYGNTILRESDRLLSLINDTIRLSEIEETSGKENRTQIFLPDLFNEIRHSLITPAENRGIEIQSNCEEIYIEGNKSYMSEMLFNLVDNAIKYNIDKGTVTMSAFKKDNSIVISVKDTGIGISPKYHSRVFERFFRVDKSRSKQSGGTGLGLSIVKHTAINQGGYVDIKSELGKGTEVIVTFPK